MSALSNNLQELIQRIRPIAAGLQHDVAEDIISETILLLIPDKGHLSPEELYAYATTVARHVRANWFRRVERGSLKLSVPLLEEPTTRVSQCLTTDLDDFLNFARFLAPDHSVTLFLAVEMDYYSLQEAAELVGCPRRNAGKLYKRGRSLLRLLYGEPE